MSHDREFHDIVVIGASAGGLEPLRQLLRDLPPDPPASIFIVMHVAASSVLPAILARASALPLTEAVSGEKIERGRVYVDRPDVICCSTIITSFCGVDHRRTWHGPRSTLCFAVLPAASARG
jgi:chemotaxis response regulator CheB